MLYEVLIFLMVRDRVMFINRFLRARVICRCLDDLSASPRETLTGRGEAPERALEAESVEARRAGSEGSG